MGRGSTVWKHRTSRKMGIYVEYVGGFKLFDTDVSLAVTNEDVIVSGNPLKGED